MNHLLRCFALLGVLSTALTNQAQRIAFVNSKYILEQMPDYQSAQSELDRFSTQWQKEIDDRWAQVKRLRDAFNAEAILLTEDMKRTRMEDIEKKEREARELAGTSYVAIFDIGGMGNNVLYASEKYDKSDAVLRKLGIKPGKSTNSGNLREDEEAPDEPEETPPQEGGGRDGGSPPPPRSGGGDGGGSTPVTKPR
jgi:outer membrane protein